METGAQGLFGLEVDNNGQLWYTDGPGNVVAKVVVDEACPDGGVRRLGPSSCDLAGGGARRKWCPTDEDWERYHEEAPEHAQRLRSDGLGLHDDGGRGLWAGPMCC